MKMNDLTPDPSGPVAALLYKFLPAGVGAAIMVAVDLPASRRELFLRVFVAMAGCYLWGGVVMDWLTTVGWLAFIDPSKREHQVAVNGALGAVGWSAVGAGSMWLKRFRMDPGAAAREVKS
jgi:hypothetical protein